jgi:hypothetical protein
VKIWIRTVAKLTTEWKTSGDIHLAVCKHGFGTGVMMKAMQDDEHVDVQKKRL